MQPAILCRFSVTQATVWRAWTHTGVLWMITPPVKVNLYINEFHVCVQGNICYTCYICSDSVKLIQWSSGCVFVMMWCVLYWQILMSVFLGYLAVSKAVLTHLEALSVRVILGTGRMWTRPTSAWVSHHLALFRIDKPEGRLLTVELR